MRLRLCFAGAIAPNERKNKVMDKEMTLRCIMAIIYRNGHWTNQSEKIDEINLLINKELNIPETADEYNNRNRIS